MREQTVLDPTLCNQAYRIALLAPVPDHGFVGLDKRSSGAIQPRVVANRSKGDVKVVAVIEHHAQIVVSAQGILVAA